MACEAGNCGSGARWRRPAGRWRARRQLTLARCLFVRASVRVLLARQAGASSVQQQQPRRRELHICVSRAWAAQTCCVCECATCWRCVYSWQWRRRRLAALLLALLVTCCGWLAVAVRGGDAQRPARHSLLVQPVELPRACCSALCCLRKCRPGHLLLSARPQRCGSTQACAAENCAASFCPAAVVGTAGLGGLRCSSQLARGRAGAHVRVRLHMLPGALIVCGHSRAV